MTRFKTWKGYMQYVHDIEFGMLQVHENEISLRKWSDGSAHSRAPERESWTRCSSAARHVSSPGERAVTTEQ